MTQEAVRALADKELTQVIAWAQDEQRVRAEQRKHDTIAKIKELAGAAGISVSIHSKRGRPQKTKAASHLPKLDSVDQTTQKNSGHWKS